MKTSKDLWQFVKPLIREIESDDGCLIIDDSIEEKPYTDENEIVCRHYDHSQQMLVKGINFLSCLYQTKEMALPIGFDLIRKTEKYIDPKDGTEKRRSPISKNELARPIKSSEPLVTKSSFVLCCSMSGLPAQRI